MSAQNVKSSVGVAQQSNPFFDLKVQPFSVNLFPFDSVVGRQKTRTGLTQEVKRQQTYSGENVFHSQVLFGGGMNILDGSKNLNEDREGAMHVTLSR